MSDNSRSSSSSSSSEETKQSAILCDMCTGEEGERRAALKTCMKCEISMCAQHLQPHLTTPVLLLAHPLTEPVAPGAEGFMGGTTKCPQHGKLLEYYCLDDLTMVCVSCAIEDQHRLHNMKTLPKAHAVLVEKLGDGEQAVAARREASGLLGAWGKREGEKLGSAGVHLVEAVNKLRDLALNRVQSSVSARMGSVAAGESSIQAAKGEKDAFRFLQLYSQVHRDVESAKAVDQRMGLETGEERDKLAQELVDAGADVMARATKLCGTVLMFVDPENHQLDFSGNAKVTFDPLALGAGMSVSEDDRTVFYSKGSGLFPPHTLMLKSPDSIQICRWTIAVSQHYNWTIGFGDTAFSSNQSTGHVYALRIQGGQLSYLTTTEPPNKEVNDGGPSQPQVKTIEWPSHVIAAEAGAGAERMMVSRPTTVEVYWSPSAFSLSFFSHGLHYQRRLIVAIDVMRTSPPLNPYVQLESKTAQEAFLTTKDWSCSCGMIYTQQSDGYYAAPVYNAGAHFFGGGASFGGGGSFAGGGYHTEAGYAAAVKVSRCVCGKVTGPPPVTDVLCELL